MYIYIHIYINRNAECGHRCLEMVWTPKLRYASVTNILGNPWLSIQKEHFIAASSGEITKSGFKPLIQTTYTITYTHACVVNIFDVFVIPEW